MYTEIPKNFPPTARGSLARFARPLRPSGASPPDLFSFPRARPAPLPAAGLVGLGVVIGRHASHGTPRRTKRGKEPSTETLPPTKTARRGGVMATRSTRPEGFKEVQINLRGIDGP